MTDDEIYEEEYDEEIELKIRIDNDNATVLDFDGDFAAFQQFCADHNLEVPIDFDPITFRPIYEKRYNGLSDWERQF